MKKIPLLIVAAALSLSACASGPVHSKDEALNAIKAAEQANKKAKSVGNEWKNTGKIIKKAKAALKKADYDKAIKLANKARNEGINAVKQHEEQKNASQRL